MPSISYRIALEGADVIAKDLESLGKAGVKAFQDIKAAADKAGGLDKLKPDEIRAKLQQLGITGEDAFRRITRAVDNASRLENFTAAMQTVQAGIGAMAAGIARALGPIGAAVGAAVVGFQQMANAAQALTLQLSTAAGESRVSIERFDGLRRVFNAAGVSTENFLQLIKAINNELAKTRVDQVKRLADEVLRLRQAGQVDVAGLVALQSIARGAGEEAKIATEALQKLSQVARTVEAPRFTLPVTLDDIGRVGLGLEVAAQKAGQFGKQISTVTTPAKDAATAAVEFAQKVAGLATESDRLRLVQEKIPGASKAVADAIATIGRRTDLTREQILALSREYERQAVAAEQASQRSAAAWQNLQLEIGKLGIGPGLNNLSAQVADAFTRAAASLVPAAQKLSADFDKTFAGGESAASLAFQGIISRWNATVVSLINTNAALAADFATTFAAGESAASLAFQKIANFMTSTLIPLFERARLAFTSIFTGAGGAGGAGTGTEFAPGGFARGGYTGRMGTRRIAGVVHGGEYVQPAHVVRQPGVLAFMEALRRAGGDLQAVIAGFGGFDVGGLVGPTLGSLARSLDVRVLPGLQSFEAGGPVGRGPNLGTLTLELGRGGDTVEVRATSDVVDQLRRAASLFQIRSGGRKPSRYT